MLRELNEEEETNVRPKVGRGAIVALIAASSIALGAGASSGAPVTVSATLLQKWSPSSTTVHKGTRVVWKNPANFGTEHNVRSYGANWTLKKQVLEPGESFGKRFRKRGTFRYRCTIHSSKTAGGFSGMVGKIRVIR